MTIERKDQRPALGAAGGVTARSTVSFAGIGDHARLPARFFARLQAHGGSLLRR